MAARDPGAVVMDTGATSSGVRTVNAVAGEIVEIHLWEDRTRGEGWMPLYDPATLTLVSDDYLRTISGNAVDAGRRTFAFRPVRAGTHRLVFEKRMGWKFTAEDQRVFLVSVTDPPPSSVEHA